MLVLLMLLISRLINRSGLRISHSKVFSSVFKILIYHAYTWSDKAFRGKSVFAIFERLVTWNYAYSPFNRFNLFIWHNILCQSTDLYKAKKSKKAKNFFFEIWETSHGFLKRLKTLTVSKLNWIVSKLWICLKANFSFSLKL